MQSIFTHYKLQSSVEFWNQLSWWPSRAYKGCVITFIKCRKSPNHLFITNSTDKFSIGLKSTSGPTQHTNGHWPEIADKKISFYKHNHDQYTMDTNSHSRLRTSTFRYRRMHPHWIKSLMVTWKIVSESKPLLLECWHWTRKRHLCHFLLPQ